MNYSSLSNRKLLSGIVYSKKKSFYAKEIEDEYRYHRKNLVVDGAETIRGFLNGLVELNVLKRVGIKYEVIEK